jgi:hemerythrin-like domain-containing protein
MTSPATAVASDPWEMALIHRLIRRGFEQAGQAVLAPGAAGRVGPVAEYIRFHLDGLQAHHSSEDELIWPVLHERASLSDALISRMEDQHAGVHDALETTRAELEAWTASPTASGSQSLASALESVVDGLATHLAEEERDVVPLIAAHVTQAEWEHLGKVAFGKFTPKQRFIAMGEMLTAAEPAEATRMLAGIPAPIKLVWALVGRRRYERLVSQVRG